MAIFKELRERRLVQIVVSYAAAGWIVLEAFDQLVDRGVLPDFAYYLALLWYLAGLVAATVIGWYHGEKGDQKATRGEIALLSLVGICGLAISGVILNRHLGEELTGVTAMGAGELDPTRIAVLYLADGSRDRSLGYLADGLTEALIEELSSVSALRVVSKNGSLQFKDSDLPRDSIARSLQAGTLVGGSVDRAGDRVRVNVALSDGTSGAEFRRGTFEEPGANLFELQTDLAEQVAGFLREWLGEEIDLRSGGRETENVAAWALLQRGERERKDGEAFLARGEDEALERAFQGADSLWAEAEALDPSWPRPAVKRAELAIRWTQLHQADPLRAGEWIQRGFEHAERALALESRDAGALEARGILRYSKWVLRLEPDPTEAERLLEGAEEDLRAAVRDDPTRASAWNILSMIHSQKPDPVEAKIAARRSYEEDAYLRGAENVLWRLYATSYDLEQFPDAVQYCNEGRRRFPEAFRFVECQLWLLASRALEPDVDRAWALLPELDSLGPPQAREYTHLKGQILVGGVLARAGLADSAHAVWSRSRGNPEIDPGRDLLALEAVFRLQNGEQDEALDLVRTYLTLHPEHRAGWVWTSHWWWRDLQANPEFRELVGSGTS